MFRNPKNPKPAKRSKGGGGEGGGGGAALMQQMGFQIPNFDESNIGADDDDDDDDTLEAELRQIQGDIGGHTSKRPKANQKKPSGSNQDLLAFHNDVNKLLGDIDRPINDDELSEGDEEDLLNELHEITGEIESENQMNIQPLPLATANTSMLSVLETRREMYVKAVEAAKTSGDASKARRLDRQLKLIQELLQSARTGAPINESDIPPALFVSGSTSASVTQEVAMRDPSPPPLPPPPVIAKQSTLTSLSTNNQPITTQLASTSISNSSDEAIARLKTLALQAKTEGDIAKAKEYLIQMKNLQNGITANNASMPSVSIQTETSDDTPNEINSATSSMPLLAPEPGTILEALQQRHVELTKRHQDAISKGDNSKARRMDRLSKQYQEAIEATQKGRPYDYSELAELPGFAPIPVAQSKPQQQSAATGATAVSIPARSVQSQQQRPSQIASSMSQPTTKTSTTMQSDQSVQSIRLKQEQLQKLALQAKQKGDIESAKKYLIACKELEPKIVSSESNIPMDTIQVSESSSNGFEVICDNDLTEELAQADRDTIYRRLQEDLLRQMQLCARNQQMYAQMEGIINVQQANEFKILEQRCAHDLERLRQCFQHDLKAPLFHYEKRQMHIVQVNNDLTDNDFENFPYRHLNSMDILNIMYNFILLGEYSTWYKFTCSIWLFCIVLETYVITEFPYPPETPQTARTRHGTGSAIVEYADSLHKFQIKLNDNKFKRLMSRKEVKLSIFYKVGFLRSDRLLGVAYKHLDRQNLRKYHPQRWLVIDRFEDIPHNSKPSTSKSPSTAPTITTISRLIPTGEALGLLAVNLAKTIDNNNDLIESRQTDAKESKDNNRRDSQLHAGPQSIQVLKYEADLLQDQIEQLEEHLSSDQIDQLRLKLQELKDQSTEIVQSLRRGGNQALQDHVRNLQLLLDRYDKESNDYRQRNEIKKADIFLHKKTLVTQEIETLTN
ncbi:hypothetical protein I4U23_008777 [Adineta vaga]|nr:hypothetical protein I4U23_008777 [Adineta vaga]